MLNLQPIALIANDDNTYLVRFRTEAGEAEYTFVATEDPLLAVEIAPEYSKASEGDPAVPILCKAVANFHKARNYKYED